MESLWFDGSETFDVELNDSLESCQGILVKARKKDGSLVEL